MKITLSCDHAGFEQLKKIQDYLQSLGYECKNFGPKSFNRDDDYPDFILPAARAVSRGEYDKGIIIGGSGQGEAMTANRFPGVRCAVYYGPAVPKMVVDSEGRTSHDPYEIVRLSRQHNDANMLSFGARFVSVEEMKNVTKLWLDTGFAAEKRHLRRIQKIDQKA